MITLTFLGFLVLSICDAEKGPLDFGLSVFSALSSKNIKNMALSPVNLVEAATLLYEASSGHTQEAMSKIIGFNFDKQMMRNESYHIYKKLKDASNGGTYSYQSLLLVDDRIPINPVWGNEVVRYHAGSSIHRVDVMNTAVAAKRINGWVRRVTNGTITSVVTDNSIPPEDVALVIASANYFQYPWTVSFDEHKTSKRQFTGSDGHTAMVDFMHGNSRYFYNYDENLKASFLCLPYKNSNFVMVLALPDEGTDLEALIKYLDREHLAAAVPKDIREISVYIPKFSMKVSLNLNSVLKELGLENMYSMQLNLKDMTPVGGIKLTNAIQVSHLEVSESGTKASSSLEFSFSVRSLLIPKTFDANHPFAFYIIERDMTIPLYVGKIENFQ